MPLTTGQTLQNRYCILGLLGQGGMGAVYQAADTRLGGKSVAIKEMSDAGLPTLQQRQQAVDAFRQEAQMLALLNHPNLPKVTDFFSENGKHYIVMEFVEGETLESYLQRQRVGEAQVRMWAAQLFDVLGYLHRQSPPVIFRDLKPANIMLTPQGQLKLIDFGIARLFKTGKPGDTLVMGTPGYAAPEQHGIGQTDARSDIYSLGVVLHQALTGYDPSLTPFVLPPVQQFNPSVSPQMEQAISKAIQTDRLQRFQSVDEFRSALAAGVTAPGAQTVKTGPAGGQAGKLAMGVAGVAVLILLAFVGGRTLIGGGSVTPAPPGTLVVFVETTAPAEPEVAPGARSSEVAPEVTGTETPDPAPIDTPLPEPSATPIPDPTETPTLTPTSTDTASPTAKPTPTPKSFARAAAADLNVRSGPSTDFEIVSRLGLGEEVQVTGRNNAGDWLRVVAPGGIEGWANSDYLTTELGLKDIVVASTPALPACRYAVDSQLASAYTRSQLGCAIVNASIVWSAWQPFQSGAMLWRSDTNRVVVFHNDNRTWIELPDQWSGQETPYRGNPPGGTQQPIRGFGWIWGTRDEVFSRLGWAVDEERGFCARIQSFERGFIVRSDTSMSSCQDGLANRARELGSLLISVYPGGWQRR